MSSGSVHLKRGEKERLNLSLSQRFIYLFIFNKVLSQEKVNNENCENVSENFLTWEREGKASF